MEKAEKKHADDEHGHGHEEHGHKKESRIIPKENPTSFYSWIISIIILFVLLSAVIFGLLVYEPDTTPKRILTPAELSELAEKQKANQPAQSRAPGIQSGTTPWTVTADYEFYIECNEPIALLFPGKKKPVIYPGKGVRLTLPKRKSGPIEIYDPNNENGNISVRIYPTGN